MARMPRQIGRGRAMEVLLGSDDMAVLRPSTQARFKTFRELGWHKPGDAESSRMLGD
jgi:hypothetical protein